MSPSPAWSPSSLPDAGDGSLGAVSGGGGSGATLAPSGIATAEAFGSSSVSVAGGGIQVFDSGPAGSWELASAAPSYYRDSWHKARITPGSINPTLSITATAQATGTNQAHVYKSTDGGTTFAYLQTITGSFTVDTPLTISAAVVCSATDILEVVAGARLTITGLSPGTYQAAPATPSTRLILVGDSITQGYTATPDYLCWANLLAHDLPSGWRVTNMGFTGQVAGAYNTNTTIDALSTKITARADGTAKNIIVVALGVNDFVNGQNLAAFSSGFQAFATRLRTNHPACGICIITPLIYTTNDTVANSAGATMPQFRSAIDTAMSGISDSLVIDGLSILLNADESDGGVHPNNTGHGKYELAARALILAKWYSALDYATLFKNASMVVQSDKGVTSSGGFVDGWADQSGNGKNGASTTTKRPAIITGPNSKPAFQFDGVDDELAFSTLNMPAPGTTPQTVYAVVRQDAWTLNRALFGSPGSQFTMRCLQFAATPDISLNQGVRTVGGPAIGSWGRFCGVWNNTLDTIKYGASTQFGSGATPGNTANTGFTLANQLGSLQGAVSYTMCAVLPYEMTPSLLRAADMLTTSIYGGSVAV